MNGILRPGLLAGVRVAIDAPAESNLFPELQSLGAEVTPVDGEPTALVLDCSGWLPGPEPGTEPLQQLLDRVWQAVEAVANRAFIAAGEGGQIVFVAPAQRDRFGVPAAVAALENLSRTLSVEWARYRITVSTVAPTELTSDAHLATLVAYLLSSAGAYFSGARLDLNALPG